MLSALVSPLFVTAAQLLTSLHTPPDSSPAPPASTSGEAATQGGGTPDVALAPEDDDDKFDAEGGFVSHRQRRIKGAARRTVHELKDPSQWPAEPQTPTGAIDAARFTAALFTLCQPVAAEKTLPQVTQLVWQIAEQTQTDAFLLGALVLHQSNCRPQQNNVNGVGLLQIQPQMFDHNARLPVPASALSSARLLDPAQNLATGAALLKMWQQEHQRLDVAFPEAPHRSGIAHFIWGDRVWGAGGEDRVLTARRRLLQLYADSAATFIDSPLGFPIVSPLGGVPRLGTSGPGADRDGGKRAHRGLDIDAAEGEPVAAIADGVVQFAGADLPGALAAVPLLPKRVKKYRARRLGPGGIFVRIEHTGGTRTGYFHLHTFNVVPGQTVAAGEIIGTVGRTGVKVSPTHLHFEVQQGEVVINPAAVLTNFVIPPEATLTHDLAMAQKQDRLLRERRARRHRHQS